MGKGKESFRKLAEKLGCDPEEFVQSKMYTIRNNEVIKLRLWNFGFGMKDEVPTLVTIKHLSADTFNEFPNLEHIDLSYNLLSDIHPNLFAHNPKLTSIDLGNNRISWLESNNFTDVPNLESLKLSPNIISKLPPNIFDQLHNLKYLTLSYNLIKKFPETLVKNLKI